MILPSGEWRTAAITLREVDPPGPDHDVRLLVGDLASVFVDFLIVGFVLFLTVRAINKLKGPPPPAAAPTTRECPECLEQIALAAKRCKFCTSALPAG
jgi:large conductance mechanosensitive channel